MRSSTLDKLIREKDGACLSLILPMHTTSADRMMDPKELSKLRSKVKELLLLTYDKNIAKDLDEKLNTLVEKVDFVHNSRGLGFFISHELSEIVHFPFEVKEKVFVGENFLIKDLLYLKEFLENYYTLSISKKDIRLFKGNGAHLEEINDQVFPIEVYDDYEYEKPSFGNSFSSTMKSFEKEKSEVAEIRLEHFLKNADKGLNQYLTNGINLIISGVKQDIGYFQKITAHSKYISGKVIGNYHDQLHILGNLAHNEKREYQKVKNQLELANLNEKIGKHEAVSGLTYVWNAASLGKGLQLFVERDHDQRAFVKQGDKYNLVQGSLPDDHEIIVNAIENVVRMVLEKNGKVKVVDNGLMDREEKIALRLRYQ